MKKRHILIGAVVSALLGLGSCHMAAYFPYASPISDWDESDGMGDWNSWMKERFPSTSAPDWCIAKSEFFGDVSYVKCYSPLKKEGDQHFYSVASCTIEWDADSRDCDLGNSEVVFTSYEVGKYKRFLGGEELLFEEKIAIEAKSKLELIGLVLFFLVSPGLIVLMLIWHLFGDKKV